MYDESYGHGEIQEYGRVLFLREEMVLMVKNLPTSTRDARGTGLIFGLGRFSGVGNGNLLQYSCLENSMEISKLIL